MRLHVHDRVMTSHEACISGIFRVLTVAFVATVVDETLIPVPTDCEVRSLIKFLNAGSITPVEIHRQLCQVYGHTWLDGQHFLAGVRLGGV